MITTLSSIGDEAVANSNAVLMRMQGHRTPEERVCEYFGIKREDFNNSKALKLAGVRHTPRLAELGLSKEKFEAMFSHILDFTITPNEGSTIETSSTNGLATESELSTGKKGAGRPKK